MKIKFKGELSPIMLVLLFIFLSFIVMVYIAVPQAFMPFGFSYGYRWQLPYSSTGRITRTALRRVSKDMDSGLFYAHEGDQILLSRNIEIERGHVFNSLWKKRFWPPHDMVWSGTLLDNADDRVVIEIEEDGFYYFAFYIHKFEGKVEFAWEKYK